MKFNLKNINFQNKFLGLIAVLLFGVSVVDNKDPYIATKIAESSEYPSRKSTYSWNDVFKRPERKQVKSVSNKNLSYSEPETRSFTSNFKKVPAKSFKVDPYSVQAIEDKFRFHSARGVNFNKPVLFEYYFYNNRPEPLEQMANSLMGENFTFDISKDNKGTFWLKLDEVTIHNPRSLHNTDERLYQLAKEFRLRGYDGYEITKIDRHIEHPNFNKPTPKYVTNTASTSRNSRNNLSNALTINNTDNKQPAQKTYNKFGRPTSISRDLGTPNTRFHKKATSKKEVNNVHEKALPKKEVYNIKEKALPKQVKKTSNKLFKRREGTEPKKVKKEAPKKVDHYSNWVKRESSNSAYNRYKSRNNELLNSNSYKVIDKYRSNSFRRADFPYIVVLNTAFDGFKHKTEYQYIIDITTQYPTIDALELPTREVLGELDGLEGKIEQELDYQNIPYYFVARTTTQGTRRIYYATNDKDRAEDLMKAISYNLNFQFSVRKDKKWDIYKELRKDVDF